MHIDFRSEKLRREFEDERLLVRERGRVQTEKIKRRLTQIAASERLESLRNQPGHFHELVADKDGWLACDLDGPNRLIFEVADEPVPRRSDGGLDWSLVTCIRILGVLNYHERNRKKPV